MGEVTFDDIRFSCPRCKSKRSPTISVSSGIGYAVCRCGYSFPVSLDSVRYCK